MIKRFSKIIFISFLIIYLELITKIIMLKTTSYIPLTIIFSIPVILFIVLITSIGSPKLNKIILSLITVLFSIYSGFQGMFYYLFQNIFSLNTISLASNIREFKNLALDIILKNICYILLYLIPIIIFSLIFKKIDFNKYNKRYIMGNILLIIITFLISISSLQINKNKIYSPYNLYYKLNNEIKTVEALGVFTYTRIDFERTLFGFNETINKKYNQTEKKEDITYNEIEIDFESLINKEKNTTIKNMLEYFKESSPTNKNSYTGMFKGKNLIFILAEGFNMLAVDKELTPTLYKLTHEGFFFDNFYSPVFLSTTGGEFQATTGLIPTQETLSLWKKNQPNIYYALGNSFKRINYQTFSYHNWTYTFYSRNKTMKTLGYDNYLGCGNGLEKEINCRWLPSDISLIEKTFPKYQNNTPFITYYITVSGHAPYVYNSTGNSIARKNTSLVQDLPYSNNVKAYLATQIEFDRALETLIKSLREAGILDNTVISFVGDHYPYTLTTKEINELSPTKRDEVIEVNHSYLAIWNNSLKKSIKISKVGSEIDVLPTLLNLFGIEYDSRLIIGKDILSDNPGLAIFSDRSWVTDLGTFTDNQFKLGSVKSFMEN